MNLNDVRQKGIERKVKETSVKCIAWIVIWLQFEVEKYVFEFSKKTKPKHISYFFLCPKTKEINSYCYLLFWFLLWMIPSVSG